MSDIKKSQAQLSAEYNVSVKTIGRWKKEGVDIYDELEVSKHRSKGGSMSYDSNESIHEQIAKAQTLEEAKFIKMKVDASRSQHALEVSEGTHIKKSEVKESSIRVLTILKAGMQKQESDLPNKLYGLSAVDIQLALRESHIKLLNQFSEIAQQEFSE
jgi:hypothetical protein